MKQLLCFLLIPLLALAAAGRNTSGARSCVLAAARYAALALAIAQITAIVMVPFGRAAIRIAWNGMGGAFLYVDYGTVAAAFACCVSAALGFGLRLCRKRVHARIGDRKETPAFGFGSAGAAASVADAFLYLGSEPLWQRQL